MTDVSSLSAARADRAGDNTLISPAECMEDFAREIRNGEVVATGALVIRVTDTGDNFDVGWRASNLKCSEMLAALELARVLVLEQMLGD